MTPEELVALDKIAAQPAPTPTSAPIAPSSITMPTPIPSPALVPKPTQSDLFLEAALPKPTAPIKPNLSITAIPVDIPLTSLSNEPIDDFSGILGQPPATPRIPTVPAEEPPVAAYTPPPPVTSVVESTASPKEQRSGYSITLPAIWKEPDVAKASEIAKKHGLTQAQLFAIFEHETGGSFDPAQKAYGGGSARGLIQFVPSTAADILMSMKRRDAIKDAEERAKAEGLDPVKTKQTIKEAMQKTPLYWQLSKKDRPAADAWGQQAIERLDVNKQLDVVDYYIDQNAKGKKGLRDIYTAIFTGNPSTDSIRKGTQAYNQNKPLDKNKDGVIEEAEWMGNVVSKSRKIKEVNPS